MRVVFGTKEGERVKNMFFKIRVGFLVVFLVMFILSIPSVWSSVVIFMFVMNAVLDLFYSMRGDYDDFPMFRMVPGCIATGAFAMAVVLVGVFLTPTTTDPVIAFGFVSMIIMLAHIQVLLYGHFEEMNKQK